MKVLVFGFHDVPPGYIGGGWIRTMEILRRGKRHGVEYFMIENKPSLRDVYGIDYKGIEVEVVGIPANRFHRDLAMIKAIRRGIELARDEDFDLILSPNEQHMCVLPAYFTSKLTGIPWTAILQLAPVYWSLAPDKIWRCTSRFRDVYAWFRYACECSTRHAVTATVVSSLLFRAARSSPMLAVGQGIVEDMRIIDAKVETVLLDPSYAVDLNRIPSSDQPKEFDGLYAAPQKGVFDLLEMWSYVVDRRPEATLAIVGKASRSTLALIEKTAEELGLRKNLRIQLDERGKSQEEIWSFMKRSKIYVYPSRVDSWALTVAEALACGLPVVAYDIPAIRYAHGNCPAVQLVQVDKARDFASKCLQLLSDQELLGRTSLQGTAYARKNYDWDKVVEAEKQAYMKVIRASAQTSMQVE